MYSFSHVISTVVVLFYVLLFLFNPLLVILLSILLLFKSGSIYCLIHVQSYVMVQSRIYSGRTFFYVK
jgi:hypothetical protein